MRNLKRVFSLALALVMVLGMMVITTSAADFTDAEKITKKEAVAVMSELGIIKGMGDGTFAPDATLTRAQAAKILAYVMLGEEVEEYLTGSAAAFTDVEGHWAAKYVTFCKNMNVVDGVGNGKFNPNDKLTVVAFAKMLLCAIEAEGTFTGSGWEQEVKKAFNSIDELAATGIKISHAEITREEACELALAAMKAGEDYSLGYYIAVDDEMVEEFEYFDSYADAYIMAKTMDIPDFTIEKHKDTRSTLLYKNYGFYCERDKDDFGRPATVYTNKLEGNKLVEHWFVDTAVKSYVDEVKGGTVFADLGSPKAAQTFTVYVDGVKLGAKSVELTTAAIAKDSKANAVQGSYSGVATALTGNGVATEIYAAGKNAWTIVVVNTYADTVKKVVPADAKTQTPAYIILNDCNKAFVTDAFAEKDAVLYTIADGVVQSVVKNETVVEGKVTKITDKGVYTIGEKDYTISMTAGELGLSLDATKAGAWYVDAYGHLIAVKTPAAPPADVWYFGVVLGAQGQNYVAAGTADLLGDVAEKGKEAKEVILMLKADGEVEVLNTAWEYVKNSKGKITGVDFINGGATPEISSGLVKYTLKDGKVAKIAKVETEIVNEGDVITGATAGAMTIKKGEATLDGKFVNDNTLYFVLDDEDAVIYTGYKAIPTEGLAATACEYFYATTKAGVDTSSIAAVLVTVEDVEVSVKPEYNLVWFAGTEKYTTKAGTATVTTFTNVYINGVKGEISFKGTLPQQLNGVVDGGYADCGPATLYIVSFDKDGYAQLWVDAPYANIGKVDESNREVTKIESGYFVCGSAYYVGANTEYYQVDSTTYAVEKVEGLPALSATGAYAVKVITVGGLGEYEGLTVAKPADIVYFTVVEAE